MTGSSEPTVPTPLYRLLVRLLAPVLLGHLLWRALRDGGARYARERLGFGETARPSGAAPRRWVHAASVGEVMTVLPLIETALERGPVEFLVTTNTPTGAAVLARRAPCGVRHRYLPIDWPGATCRFLERERPASGWIVETEIWPWLYARCRRRALPLTIVNARLSRRTTDNVRSPLAATYRRALSGVEVLARSAEDAAAYRTLGAEAARTRIVGELKFAGARAPDSPPAPIEGPYVLAASTHQDEETRLARAWLGGEGEGLLVIVPRHPERGGALARELPGCRRRALGQWPAPGARLYLADTLGELDSWYAHARGVFVGGSLVDRGGHNVLEPARHGRSIVVGPHTANFTAAMAALRAREAIVEVEDAEAVTVFLERTLAADAALAEQGTRAGQVAKEGEDIAARYLARLLAEGESSERSATD